LASGYFEGLLCERSERELHKREDKVSQSLDGDRVAAEFTAVSQIWFFHQDDVPERANGGLHAELCGEHLDSGDRLGRGNVPERVEFETSGGG
jgi:hypothetical protein